MTQLEAIPLRIIEYRPFTSRRTMHAIGRALGEDGNYYFVKANQGGDLVCATEWVCNSLADSLNLPVANPKILRTNNGELVYGTREFSPKLADIEAARLLFGQAGNNVFVPELAQVLSSTYALDLVVGNIDRHQDNFVISLEAANSAGQQVGHVNLIDFGCADLLEKQKLPLPLPQNSNTVRIGRQLRHVHGFARTAAETLLLRMREGRKFLLERAMFGMPSEWLTREQRESFGNWFTSPQFEHRINVIGQGLVDGSYL